MKLDHYLIFHDSGTVTVRMGNTVDSVLIAKGNTRTEALAKAAERIQNFAMEIERELFNLLGQENAA